MAEMAAGRNALGHLLDRAGVVLASFGASGETARWSGGAETFTGRTQPDVPHFHSASAALGFTDGDRARFTAWFWSDAPEPFVAVSTFPTDGGKLRQRRMVWRSLSAALSGHADRRTLVGVEVPEAPPAPSAPADPLEATVPTPPAASGDGFRQHAPFEPSLAFGGIDIAPAPTQQEIDEEEAWIRRLASELPDAFGGGGSRRERGGPPGGGSWIAKGPGADDPDV
jgi:PAS domain-containing protein